jgi:hypothetical protein
MEQTKNGSQLVNASEATTWIDIAYLEGRRSIQLSYGRVDTIASVYGAYLIFDNRQLRHGILIVPNFVTT